MHASPGATVAPLLQVEGLTKRFGGLVAVDDVSFTVAAGSITAIIGPNGAGKSTCFNAIGGAYPPTSGRLVFDGTDVTPLPDYRRSRLGIARTFQATAVFRELSALDNVGVGYRMRTRGTFVDALFRTPRHRRDVADTRERAYEALRFTGLETAAFKRARELTQEQQRRLALAIAFVGRPKLLLLDEPVAGVSHEEMGAHAELIRKIAAAGCTICLVEHKMFLVMGLADKIVVLHHGRKIADGVPAAVAADPAVVTAYLGAKPHA